MRRRGWIVALALATACAPRPVLDRAIVARGGPSGALIRESEVDVFAGVPGRWEWRTVVAPRELYAWSIVTNDLPNHYLYDGVVVRAFVGARVVSVDASPDAALRTHARFVAVADLDVLRAPGVEVTTSPTTDPPGTKLDVVFADRGDRYEVWLTAQTLDVWRVAGPIDLSPMARGRLVATYDDVGSVGGRRIARHIRYALDGTPLADERIRRVCVLAERLPATVFASPAALPACLEPRSP